MSLNQELQNFRNSYGFKPLAICLKHLGTFECRARLNQSDQHLAARIDALKDIIEWKSPGALKKREAEKALKNRILEAAAQERWAFEHHQRLIRTAPGSWHARQAAHKQLQLQRKIAALCAQQETSEVRNAN